MRTRIIVGVLLVIGVVGAATAVGRATEVTAKRQWTLVNFINPVIVKDRMIAGPVMILHDSQKMARGEPCTTFYRFDPKKGAKEELVSFHCKPRLAKATAETTLAYRQTSIGCKRLVEYQIAGDEEAHGVPVK